MEYLINSTSNELSNRFYGLLSPQIPLPKTGISSRAFHYLRNNNLVEYPIREEGEKRSRVNLNYFQAFWLMIVKELRAYGMPDKHLMIVKDFMYGSMLESIKKDIVYHDYSFKLLHSMGIISPEMHDNNEYSNTVDNSYYDDMFLEMSEDKDYFTNLGLALNLLIISEDTPFLVIQPNRGENDQPDNPIKINLISTKHGHNVVEEVLSNGEPSKIVVSLKLIYQELYDLDVKSEVFSNYQLITPREKKVLDAIESKNFKELSVTRKNGDFKIKIKNDGEVTGGDLKMIRRVFGLKDYENVNVKYRNDKFLYFEKEGEI